MLGRLGAAYTEPHRHYHTLVHIEYCLDLLARVYNNESDLERIELALWFHDAVYDTKTVANEAASALMAQEILGMLGSGIDLTPLILATRHDGVPSTRAEQVVVDVDLGILGDTPEAFDRYEAQVRKEYEWVPEELFWTKRREILQSFLDREWIYSTPEMRFEREDQARSNLTRSLNRGTAPQVWCSASANSDGVEVVEQPKDLE